MAWTDVEALKRLEIKSHVSPRDWTVALRAQTPWAPTPTTALVVAESARRTRRSEVDMLDEEGCGCGRRRPMEVHARTLWLLYAHRRGARVGERAYALENKFESFAGF